MIAFQRILFPVDFSEQCVAIVPAVKAMAKQFQAPARVAARGGFADGLVWFA